MEERTYREWIEYLFKRGCGFVYTNGESFDILDELYALEDEDIDGPVCICEYDPDMELYTITSMSETGFRIQEEGVVG